MLVNDLQCPVDVKRSIVSDGVKYIDPGIIGVEVVVIEIVQVDCYTIESLVLLVVFIPKRTVFIICDLTVVIHIVEFPQIILTVIPLIDQVQIVIVEVIYRRLDIVPVLIELKQIIDDLRGFHA